MTPIERLRRWFDGRVSLPEASRRVDAQADEVLSAIDDISRLLLSRGCERRLFNHGPPRGNIERRSGHA